MLRNGTEEIKFEPIVADCDFHLINNIRGPSFIRCKGKFVISSSALLVCY
jgi:hypothetical protein